MLEVYLLNCTKEPGTIIFHIFILKFNRLGILFVNFLLNISQKLKKKKKGKLISFLVELRAFLHPLIGAYFVKCN